MKILVLNGPNLNMLGIRNPKIYGSQTLQQLNGEILEYVKTLGVGVSFLQSNSEGQLIDILQTTDADGVVLNAGAYTHYSLALRDCIECVAVPVVEAHLSDITAREEFRKVNVFTGVTRAVFCGEGKESYFKAVKFLADMLNCQKAGNET